VVRSSQLRWFRHVKHKEEDDGVSVCRNIKVAESRGRGRLKKTWWQCVENDMCEPKPN